MSALSVHVAKRFDHFSLAIHFKVLKGITVLWGASGKGKTVTLKMIAGIMQPDKGEIILNDQTLYHSEKKINLKTQKRAIRFIAQNQRLFPHFTVGQNILFGAKNLSSPEKKRLAQSLMEQYQIAELAHLYPHQISGGQTQRVLLAQAIIEPPMALLLDEPFTGLDRSLRLQMIDVLQKISNQLPIPILLVTHDCVEAEQLSNQKICY